MHEKNWVSIGLIFVNFFTENFFLKYIEKIEFLLKEKKILS